MTTTPLYVPQPNGDLCQSACIAMALGTSDVWGIRSDLEAIVASQGAEQTGDPYVMGEYLTSRVSSYKFLVDGSLNDAKEALNNGCIVITHGWFTRLGHIILLFGSEPDMRTMSYRFMLHDPNGEYDFPSGVHDTSTSGANMRYSSYGVYATCVASLDYDHARAIYSEKRLDSNLQNAWLHIIKN
ncbi:MULTISPECIES: hypothetical protein [unclassified Microcoleus]|uniref:hypothetical protein n=1 Tax=unclassified Microcoleus TaxID=2642155 RepID=UPI002FD3A106